VQFLYDIGWPATGDDQWIISLINARYGTSFAVNSGASPGKILGWTAWTHQPAAAAGSTATMSVALDAVALGVLAQTSTAWQSQPLDASPLAADNTSTNFAGAALDAQQRPFTAKLPLETARINIARKLIESGPAHGGTQEVLERVLAELDGLGMP